jgi:hypothetical protein
VDGQTLVVVAHAVLDGRLGGRRHLLSRAPADMSAGPWAPAQSPGAGAEEPAWSDERPFTLLNMVLDANPFLDEAEKRVAKRTELVRYDITSKLAELKVT